MPYTCPSCGQYFPHDNAHGCPGPKVVVNIIDPRDAEIERLRAELAEARKVIEVIVADYDGQMLLVEYEGCSPTEIEDTYKHVESARAFLARKETT